MIMMKMVLTFKTIRKILIVKNIYLLPTDKPSRLIQAEDDELMLLNELYENTYNINKHIYITSDEEIKEGDYVLYYEDKISQVLGINIDELKLDRGGVWRSSCKKIILTTDQDLIKDGVQAIDDEFLEWFVKNSTCEFVEIDEKSSDEIEKELGIYGHYIGLTESEYNEWLTNGGLLYKIVIPKEEHKQKFDIDTCRYFDIEVGCENEKCICENIPKEKPKQETLTEARVNNLIKLFGKDFDLEPRNVIESCKDSFINGAKWQQKQMYSKQQTFELMKKAFEAGFKKADTVQAGLEPKETDQEINWILTKYKNK